MSELKRTMNQYRIQIRVGYDKLQKFNEND